MALPENLTEPVIKTIPENKLLFDDGLSVSENNRSVWACSINNVLRKAGGNIGEHRFMGISVNINGEEILLAQGIWNLEQAINIKDGIEGNKPRIEDYFEYESEKGDKWISFESDVSVVKYLIQNNVFNKVKDFCGNETYRVAQSFIFGIHDEFPVNMDVSPVKNRNTDSIYLVIRIHK